MKKILAIAIFIMCFVGSTFSLNPTDRVVDASYDVIGELHLKGLDTLSKTADTIKLITPATEIRTGCDWVLVTGKITPLTGVTDSIGAIVWLAQYDDSSHLLQANPIDTITDSLSENIKIPKAKYPARRYGLWLIGSAATFSGGVKIARSKLMYGIPATYTRGY
jgi:hypothetical protein